jgi:hypothetical protein
VQARKKRQEGEGKSWLDTLASLVVMLPTCVAVGTGELVDVSQWKDLGLGSRLHCGG